MDRYCCYDTWLGLGVASKICLMLIDVSVDVLIRLIKMKREMCNETH